VTARRDSGPMLGELLATRGKLDREALFRALRHQRAHGGRLSTCLLELGAVSEDDLLHALSEQLKQPFAEADDLRAVEQGVLRLVPEKLARKHHVVPFRGSGTQLSLAMLDPHDLAALDELAFASGRRLRPHVAVEARLHEALARYYHGELSSRFTKLLDRLNRARHLWTEGEPPAAPAQATPPLHPREPLPTIHAREPLLPPLHPREPLPRPRASAPLAEAPLSPSPEAPPALSVLPAAPLPAPLAAVEAPAPIPHGTPQDAAVAPLSFADAEERLLEPAERDDVARTLVEFARGRGYTALLLMVRRDGAAGWMGAGEGLDEAAVSALRLPHSEPSSVLALRDGAALHRGPLPPLRGNGALAALLGASAAGDLLALPLRVRRRVVAVFLVASARPVMPAELADELKRLAAKASVALEMLVLKQKLQHA